MKSVADEMGLCRARSTSGQYVKVNHGKKLEQQRSAVGWLISGTFELLIHF